jgi:F0F1-type ATP synthase assembly protein I
MNIYRKIMGILFVISFIIIAVAMILGAMDKTTEAAILGGVATVLSVASIYFVIIRQRKPRKEHEDLMDFLSK